LTQLLVASALLLSFAVALGSLARRHSLPPVAGELAAGILLGPTVFGRLLPAAASWVFPDSGPVRDFFAGFNTLAAAMLLLLAGLEMRWGALKRVRREAFTVMAAGIALPFALGLGVAESGVLVHPPPGVEARVFALFYATALSISALPVIAKTLLDLGLLDTRIGSITMAAAMGDDLAGWTIFSAVLAMAHGTGQRVAVMLAATLAFAALALWGLPRLAGRFVSGHKSSLATVLALTLLCAAFTEWIGVHALFGAFISGVSLSEEEPLATEVRESVRGFVLSFFGPVFIAGIGLNADFIAGFDWRLVLITLVVACAGKLVGCGLAGIATRLPLREAAAIGVTMNARGAMEIILGAIALQNGLIATDLFVALVVMAVVTSAAVGPGLRLLGIRP
jgi:Kef-type K+ transport system membrane component KefB